MVTVELHQAAWFYCETCSKQNFHALESAEQTDEQAAANVREYLKLEEWEPIPEEVSVDSFFCPKQVQCQFCQSVFDVDGKRLGVDKREQPDADSE